MKPGTAWWYKLNTQQCDELLEMCKDKSLTYSEIGRAYNVSISKISGFALSHGVSPRMTMGPRIDKKPKAANAAATSLSLVERQLEETAKEEVALRKKIEDLQRRRAELALRFEFVDDRILVWGVAEGHALDATSAEWTQFLALEGARKLREFIVSLGAHKGGRS